MSNSGARAVVMLVLVLLRLAFGGGVIYVAMHFVLKAW